jgi:hypothetical protein
VDLIAADAVVVEIKTVDHLAPVQQPFTYLRLGGLEAESFDQLQTAEDAENFEVRRKSTSWEMTNLESLTSVPCAENRIPSSIEPTARKSRFSRGMNVRHASISWIFGCIR